MEKNKDKELDIFIKRIVKEIGSEEPSIDFTDSVLSKIRSVDEKSTVVYQPLISKSTWWILAAAVTTVLLYAFFGNPDIENNWFGIFRLKELSAFNLFGKIPDLSVSDTFVYGFLVLALFTGVQVFLLKQHFDKRYTLNKF